ncbi:MAG: LytTR family DNA-binding domain-containing protein [Methylococcaceae bacterium]
MNIIIVEDRLMARDELKYLLSLHPDVNVIGEFETTAAAWPIIASGNVNGAFLDINIATEPGAAGMDLAFRIDRLPLSNPPWIVFTTGYEEYALSAHTVTPYGYLVKPLDDHKVSAVLEKVRRTEQRKHVLKSEPRIELKHKMIDSGEIIWCTKYLPADDILFVQSSKGENSVKVQLVPGDIVLKGVNLPLSRWKTEYNLPDFIQIHKSSLVNLKYVNGYKPDPFKVDSYNVTFKGSTTELAIGKTYLTQLIDALKNSINKRTILT